MTQSEKKTIKDNLVATITYKNVQIRWEKSKIICQILQIWLHEAI